MLVLLVLSLLLLSWLLLSSLLVSDDKVTALWDVTGLQAVSTLQIDK
jgi:hypothetical protein